jgi:hypothetical protein
LVTYTAPTPLLANFDTTVLYDPVAGAPWRKTAGEYQCISVESNTLLVMAHTVWMLESRS